MDLQNGYKVVYEANKPDSAQPLAPLYATKEKSGETAISDPYVISKTADGYINLNEKVSETDKRRKYFLYDDGKKMYAKDITTGEVKQFYFASSDPMGQVIAGEEPSTTAE